MTEHRPLAMLLLGDHMVGLRSGFLAELHDAGVKVTVAVPEGVTLPELREGITVVAYPLDMRHPLRAARAVKRLRQQSGSSIVHAFSTTPATIGSIASWLDPGGIYLRTVNGLGRSFSIAGTRGKAMRFGYTAALILIDQRLKWSVFQNHDDDAWFATTPFLRRRHHSVILGSGVDLSHFDPTDVSPERLLRAQEFLGTNGRPTALLVGRRLKSKGLEDLSAAAEILHRETDRSLLFASVGYEEPNQRIASTATDAKYGDCEFRVLSAWSDMPALFAAASVVVLPTTYREGIPRVLLEAAALHKPLVAYDVPGCREIVVDGSNGSLVPVGDIRGLASALLAIMTDSELEAEYGAKSRALIEQTFDVRLIAQQYVALYRRLQISAT